MTTTENVENAFSTLPKSWIVMLETEAGNISEAGTAVMKYLTGNDFNAVVVSASKPCTTLLEHYEENGIDTEHVFILDLVCKRETKNPPENEGVLHIESPSALTNISIALNEVMEDGGKRFLFFDSITSMLIHNDKQLLSRFIHSVMTRMRIRHVNAVFLAEKDNTDEKVRAEIAQLCDKVIQV